MGKVAEKHKGNGNKDKALYWDVAYGGPSWESDFWEEKTFEEKVLPETRLVLKKKVAAILEGDYVSGH